jgi:hypothetical protein
VRTPTLDLNVVIACAADAKNNDRKMQSAGKVDTARRRESKYANSCLYRGCFCNCCAIFPSRHRPLNGVLPVKILTMLGILTSGSNCMHEYAACVHHLSVAAR